MLELLIMVQIIFCPVNDYNMIKKCMADQGYGNYELHGPFNSEGTVYVGYLDQGNQINVRFTEDTRYGNQPR